jgi:histidyl-tRNA synthetase
MRDFFPDEIAARQHVFTAVREVFESYGFAPLETPALERLEILQGKYGEEGDRLIFKVMKRGAAAPGEADLALRYDLTVPLARVVAEYPDRVGRIFKRYQIAPVWRADRPGRGRFREFYQCDVDVVGPGFGLADAECVLVLTEALRAVGLDGFEVRLNSRKVLRGLIEAFEVDVSLESGVLTALDKLDKIGEEGVGAELVERGLPAATAAAVLAALPDEDEVRKLLQSSEAGAAGLDEVDRILDLAGPAMRGGRIVFSPSLARGLSYYTGPIFEIYVEGSPSAISSGGRYDGLIGMFAGRSIPAVGGSLGIERIIPLVAGVEGAVSSPAQVLVAMWDPSFRADALASAGELRSRGIRAETYLGEDGFREQLAYASSRSIPFVVLRGPNEREKGIVTLRDLRTREQFPVPEAELPARLSELLNPPT